MPSSLLKYPFTSKLKQSTPPVHPAMTMPMHTATHKSHVQFVIPLILEKVNRRNNYICISGAGLRTRDIYMKSFRALLCVRACLVIQNINTKFTCATSKYLLPFINFTTEGRPTGMDLAGTIYPRVKSATSASNVYRKEVLL